MRLRHLFRGLLLALPIAVFALFGVWMLKSLFWPASVPYAEFGRLLEAGRVERVVVREDVARVVLEEPASVSVMGSSTPRELSAFTVRLPSSQATPDSALLQQLQAQGVDFRFEPPSQWLGILLNFLPVLLLLAIPGLFLLAVLLVLTVRRRAPDPR
ncbi:ATP-dependent metallopeptidase FtsH/Yme1/Tma family protein [Deinococcus sp. YIM 134068]|uniref:ATP-dependent metallopeptidase FtsH/Yme1/Tma family protein n=1 Tax=Deinococcus lichenicola TaxID=3118910 RepID=UPI002F920BC6